MSDVIAANGQSSEPGLSQIERVVDTFVAPKKTFTDILRSTSWWLPFLLLVLVTWGQAQWWRSRWAGNAWRRTRFTRTRSRKRRWLT